jgi:hypothetical protein
MEHITGDRRQLRANRQEIVALSGFDVIFLQVFFQTPHWEVKPQASLKHSPNHRPQMGPSLACTSSHQSFCYTPPPRMKILEKSLESCQQCQYSRRHVYGRRYNNTSIHVRDRREQEARTSARTHTHTHAVVRPLGRIYNINRSQAGRFGHMFNSPSSRSSIDVSLPSYRPIPI